MFVLGLILILLAAALLLGAMVGGADDRALFDMGSLNVSVSTTVVFLLGALTLLLLIMGLALMRTAARRAAARRREAKELSRRAAELKEREAELKREEQAHGTSATTTQGTTRETSPDAPHRDNGERV